MKTKKFSVKQTLAVVLALLMLLSAWPAVSLAAFAAPDPAAAVDDAAAAADVEALISAIGEVTFSEESKAKIKAARDAFDALTPTQRNLVSNRQILTDAEATYAVMQSAHDKQESDRKAAAAVSKLIAAIGTVTYTESSRVKILKARNAYDRLTDTQKKLVTDYETLENAEAAYLALQQAAEAEAAAQPDICPWDNVEHPDDFGGMLLRFIHGLLYFFAHLFGTR